MAKAKKKNPFAEHFLKTRPLLSASAARIAEEAWDAAIHEASMMAHAHSMTSTAELIATLRSTGQRFAAATGTAGTSTEGEKR